MRLIWIAVLAAQTGEFSSYLREEYNFACGQVIALAKAVPEEKMEWRPAPGIRSFREVLVHIAGGDVMLLGRAGIAKPLGFDGAPEVPEIRAWEKRYTRKAEVVDLVERSCKAVDAAWAQETPQTLARKVKPFGKPTTAERVYARIVAHVNEHMGQLIGYARMSGVKPPWAN